MEMTIFLKGLAIGFAMAVPIGPIGIMCIRKTLTEGHVAGLVIGLGAATADSFFSGVAAFGLTVISALIDSQRVMMRLIGGTFLLYLGVRTFLAQPVDPTVSRSNGGRLKSFLSTALLTLTNPLTIFAFIAVFAALGLGDGLSVISEWTLVLGVFTGSCLWFLLLSSGATLFRRRIDSGGLKSVNRISGVLIIISAVIAFASLL